MHEMNKIEAIVLFGESVASYVLYCWLKQNSKDACAFNSKAYGGMLQKHLKVKTSASTVIAIYTYRLWADINETNLLWYKDNRTFKKQKVEGKKKKGKRKVKEHNMLFYIKT